MRKLLLSLFLSTVSVAASFSQLAVTAGATYSKWQDDITSYRAGFFAGASYMAQSDSTPFYFSGSLLLENRGVNIDGAKEGTASEQNFRTSLYSFHVPASVGYKFWCCKDRILVVPKVGLYADFGLWGKTSQDAVVSKYNIKPDKFDGLNPYTDIADLSVGGVGDFSRFDWGAIGGFDVYLSRSIFLSASYEYGLRNLWDAENIKSRFSSFQVGLGYLFCPIRKPQPKPVEL